jgi:hypothetical protein
VILSISSQISSISLFIDISAFFKFDTSVFKVDIAVSAVVIFDSALSKSVYNVDIFVVIVVTLDFSVETSLIKPDTSGIESPKESNESSKFLTLFSNSSISDSA